MRPRLSRLCLLALLFSLTAVSQSADPPGKDPVIAGKALSAWSKAVKDPDADARLQAVHMLEQVARAGAPAVRLLRETLVNDEDARVRMAAARTLGTVGPPAAGALPNLVELMLDEEEPMGVRRQCVESLGKIGAKPAVPALYHTLKTPDLAPHVVLALQAMGQDGEPALRRAFKEGDLKVRLDAGRALGQRAGPDSVELIVLMTDSLADRDREIRELAVRTLLRTVPACRAAAPGLTIALDDISPNVRADALDILGRLGAESKSAVPKLIDMITTDKSTQVRVAAARVVRHMKKEAQPALPALATAANEPDAELARTAVQTLGELLDDLPDALPPLLAMFGKERVEPKPEMPNIKLPPGAVLLTATIANEIEVAVAKGGAPAVKFLAAALADPAPKMRACAARSLLQMAPEAGPAAAALRAALKDAEDDVRFPALRTFIGLGPAGRVAQPDLLAMLAADETDPRYLRDIGFALQAMGVEKEAVDPLTALTKHKNVQVRLAAATALGGALADGEAPLRAMTGDADPMVRQQVTASLQRIQTKKAAAPHVANLQSDKPAVRRQAALALAQIDRSERRNLPELLACLKDPDAAVRRQVVQILEKMGLGGIYKRQVLPALLPLLNDPASDVRQAAAAAVKRLDSYTAANLGIR